MSRRKLVCVSTSNPAASLTPGGGGGSITMLCPHTGSILSTLRATGDNSSSSVIGISSLSTFPDHYNRVGPPLMMGYGGTPTKKDDTYGMLLSLRSASTAPLVHWKCRLPEVQLSGGLMVSPCGSYIVGGGASGTCFVWSALGGNLLRSVKAHYRSVTSMEWSDCGSFLVTGGADGMIHSFSLLSLVERDNTRTVSPTRTWSIHHLPITCLLTMPCGRMISASEDGQVVMLELFSQKVIFRMQLPHAIRALDHCRCRLFAGSILGSIYLIDLDQYAIHQTAQLGVTVKHRQGNTKSHEEQVFSVDKSEAYKSELIGHEKPITSMTVLTEDDNEWLISGDEAGEVRIWDLESRGCVRVVRPWSTGTAKQTRHPVTAILVVSQDDTVDEQDRSLGKFVGGAKDVRNKTDIVSLVAPLQRFTDRPDQASGEKSLWIPVPFMQPKQRRFAEINGDSASTFATLYMNREGTKRPRKMEEFADGDAEHQGNDTDAGDCSAGDQSEKLLRLRQELDEAKSIIQRLEQMNNKLVAK